LEKTQIAELVDDGVAGVVAVAVVGRDGEALGQVGAYGGRVEGEWRRVARLVGLGAVVGAEGGGEGGGGGGAGGGGGGRRGRRVGVGEKALVRGEHVGVAGWRDT